MKTARVTYRQEIYQASEDSRGLLLSNGQVVHPNEVDWLPPFEFQTIFALGLNYPAHAKEINFSKAATDPLIFLKGPNTLTGHRSKTRRPADVAYMHYECELAVVIGKTCKHVSKERAYEVVRGYTVANDYAIRDYLENYYRPNLRVKNRDGCTPIGPWLVDAADVLDPMNLKLQTWVNGTLTQNGNSRDMVFNVPTLIAYLSEFMTLNPGDVILTGTPDGVTDAKLGDEIVTEIEHLGRLINTIGGDELLPMIS